MVFYISLGKLKSQDSQCITIAVTMDLEAVSEVLTAACNKALVINLPSSIGA